MKFLALAYFSKIPTRKSTLYLSILQLNLALYIGRTSKKVGRSWLELAQPKKKYLVVIFRPTILTCEEMQFYTARRNWGYSIRYSEKICALCTLALPWLSLSFGPLDRQNNVFDISYSIQYSISYSVFDE
jgi:hypothetical protein